MAAAVLALASVLLAAAGHVVSQEQYLVREVNERTFDAATTVLLTVTHLGGTRATLLICALVAGLLLARKEMPVLLSLVVAVGTTQLLVAGSKVAVSRPRPPHEDALVEADGYAFPSGHSATAAALYGTLALFAASRLSGIRRGAVIAAAAGMALVIGISRVYLGVHYPSDVLIGWLLGAGLAIGAWTIMARDRGRLRVAPA